MQLRPSQPALEWLRCRSVLLRGGIEAAAIGILAGRIARIEPFDCAEAIAAPASEELADGVLLPGIVDSHVHVNEPGRAEWEGFATATQAAAAGGVTTLVDMPLNAIPATTSLEALRSKLDVAKCQLAVDVGFWGGVVPGNFSGIEPLHRGGVLGFKAFLVDSGVEEFAAVGLADLERAAFEIARLGSVLLVHAELPDGLRPSETGTDRRSHAAWEASRPPVSESRAIDRLAAIALASGAAIHVVHLSSADGLARVRAAQRSGARLSAESCPHYLFFASEEIPDGATAWKCAPPIRGREHRDALWDGLADGSIALVASDHSPSPPPMKAPDSGDFFAAWGGISSLELALAATWTAASARGFGLDRIAEWMSAAPARLAGLEGRKGAIEIGRDADFVLFDPEASFRVDATRLRHRHPLTPYDRLELRGVVRKTWLRGAPIFEAGRLLRTDAGAPVTR